MEELKRLPSIALRCAVYKPVFISYTRMDMISITTSI